MIVGVILPQVVMKRQKLWTDTKSTTLNILKQYLRSTVYIAITGIIPSVALCHLIPLFGGMKKGAARLTRFMVITCFSLGMLGFFCEPTSKHA